MLVCFPPRFGWLSGVHAASSARNVDLRNRSGRSFSRGMPVMRSICTTRSAGTCCHFTTAARVRPRP